MLVNIDTKRSTRCVYQPSINQGLLPISDGWSNDVVQEVFLGPLIDKLASPSVLHASVANLISAIGTDTGYHTFLTVTSIISITIISCTNTLMISILNFINVVGFKLHLIIFLPINCTYSR